MVRTVVLKFSDRLLARRVVGAPGYVFRRLWLVGLRLVPIALACW
jgi:hypothetical protein